MFNKQNLWFITLFSLILVLGVYYVTIPSDVLEKVNNKVKSEEKVVAEVKEENYEKKLKKEFDLDCFTKIDNSDVEIICISEKHDKELANKIMRTIQNEYQNKMNITVKFQKKWLLE